MAEIIPAILAKDFKELTQKLNQVEPFVDWVQIDVVDGIFAKNKTWNNPKELRDFETPLKREVHLMVQNPQRVVSEWVKVAQRIVIHWEGFRSAEDFKRFLREWSGFLPLVLALNPQTPWQEVEEFIPQLNRVLLMGVEPGFGGQEFKEETLKKIESLRKAFPFVTIEVDGGINLETAKKCLAAGADILVVGSYIFQSQDIEQRILELQKLNP